MSEFIKSGLKQLSIQGLHDLARDAAYRIGSHSTSDEPIDAYIKKQKDLLQAIQDELIRREQRD